MSNWRENREQYLKEKEDPYYSISIRDTYDFIIIKDSESNIMDEEHTLP